MATTTWEMWTHGVGAQIESPDACTSVARGTGLEVQGEFKRGTWVHLAVPTPVRAAGVGMRVSEAKLRFKTESARIVHLHIREGTSLLARYDEIYLKGNWQDKTVAVPGTRVWNGVVVSAYLGFWDPVSEAEIQAILKKIGKKPKSSTRWKDEQKDLQEWREWGFQVPGTVHITGAACVFEEAIQWQVAPGAPQMPPGELEATGPGS